MYVRRPARDEGGFTLIELLLVVVIIAVVVVPLGNVVLSYFHNATATAARLNESHDAQLAAAYFGQDVASVGVRQTSAPSASLVQSIWTGLPNGSGTYPCGSSGTAIVLLAWDDTPVAGTVTLGYDRVAYTVQTVSGQTQLHRLACAGSATVVTDTVVAHDVYASAPPSIACWSGGVSVACSGSGGSVPQQVVMTVSIRDAASTASYVITLTGQRRSTS
jgi:prepilin-type N-terminal cleavage/methylation domain-containing protein